MTCFPKLETQRLWLRQAIEEDAEAVFAVFSDLKVTQFHDLDTFTHLNQAIEVIERRAKGFTDGHRIRWAIARKPDNYVIGSCGFSWDREANAAEVGYELASQFWRQGMMSEVLSAILNYGFEIEGVATSWGTPIALLPQCKRFSIPKDISLHCSSSTSLCSV